MIRGAGPYWTLITPKAGSLFHAVFHMPVAAAETVSLRPTMRVPALVIAAGERASMRFLEFFAAKTGMTILRALNVLPNEVNVVYHPGVEIFSDAAATKPIPDAKGVILETTSPGGVMKTFRIFPTTRTHFQKGKQVAWEWSMQKGWPAAWYRDPDTGTITQAWVSSAEFIGRHLDDI
jgi:hypothetical protein